MDSPAPTDTGSRLEVAAAALADQAAELEIVVHDAREAAVGDASRAVGAPVAALEALLAEARAEASDAREQLAVHVAGEAELVAVAGRLRLELDDLRARSAARDERDARVAGLVVEVADAAREAREEVERHAAARERSERELAAARTELDAVHVARDRATAAEGAASAAREAELAALKAAHARLRPAPGEPAPEQLADGLARAAQRLRDQVPSPAAEPAGPAVPSAAAEPAGPRHDRRPGFLRRLLRDRR